MIKILANAWGEEATKTILGRALLPLPENIRRHRCIIDIQNEKITTLLALAGLFLATTESSRASLILNWVEWVNPGSYPFSNSTSLPYNYASGTTGSITMPNSSVVGVTFAGEVMSSYGASAFGTNNNSVWSGANYNGSTYISANVPTLPTNSDRIGVGGYGIQTQTLTFNAPVSNIVMNIMSLGDPGTLGPGDSTNPLPS